RARRDRSPRMSRASQLREVFDRGFAAAPSPAGAGHLDLLCIAVAGEPCALLLSDVASLHAGLPIVALPTRAPELLGVAAIRASVLPIYDLAIALGMRAAAAPRWTVIHRAGRAGLAFDGHDGHTRIAEGAIAAAAQRGHVVGHVVVGGQPRSVIDLG